MLALMLEDVSFASKASDLIPADKLYSEAHRYLFERIKANAEKGEGTTLIHIEDHLKTVERHKRRMLRAFCQKIFEAKPTSPDFIKEKLTHYAQKNMFVDVFMTAQTMYNSREYDKAFEITLQGMTELYGISFRDDAVISIKDFEDRRMKHLGDTMIKARKIPTNIGPLDDMLRGGLEKGELGILLAEPKKGKSIGLVHFGAAAVLMRSARVAHFVLEGLTEHTIFRYQSRLSGIQYHRIEKDEVSAEEQKKLDGLSKYENHLDVIPFNTRWDFTVLDIEAKLKELIAAGKKPDLLVIDYADLLKSHERGLEKRHEQTEVYRDLKRLAMIHKVAIWTASQARRPDEKPEVEYLLRSKDISESFEKVRIADLVATLNQTPKEKEDGILRLHVDIYRSGEPDYTIPMLTDFERMIFYSKKYEHIFREDIPDWRIAKRGKRK